MKVCERFLWNAQVNPGGEVIQCCNMRNSRRVIGNLIDNTFDEIWNGKKNREIFNCLANGDYSPCDTARCSFFDDNGFPVRVPLVEVEDMPSFPQGFGLAYEKVCNYQCPFCQPHNQVSPEILREYEIIEERLESVLPHLEEIHTNGYGEIFVSNRTIRLLENWKPLAPKEKIHVRLITNASLFDEKHWKKIEHLGQYYLKVQTSVQTFDERTHRILSGSNIPVSTIEKNLQFIKSLREKGIINEWVWSSVVQDLNFREMPQIVRRCVEEFKPDSLLLQPIIFINPMDINSWIKDVRNKYHPYHDEYLEVIDDPIFKVARLRTKQLWRNSPVGEFPGLEYVKQTKAFRSWESQIIRKLLTNNSALENLENDLQQSGGKVIIHGAGSLGMAIAKSLSERGKIEVSYITDFKQSGDFLGIPIVHPENVPADFEKGLPVIITWLQTTQQDLNNLRNLGYTGRFIKLDEIFDYK